MIRVLVVDDQTVVRMGIKMILESTDDITVVGEAGDGETAIVQARAAKPDVILMDVQMPALDGITATRQILHEGLCSNVIILTTFERDEYVFGSIDVGASGFLLKNSPPEDLIRAVRTAARGDALLDPSVTRRVLSRVQQPVSFPDADARFATLSDREREVFQGLARGRSNAEIARSLFVGDATIKTHVSNVLAKLQLHDRSQAIIFAYEQSLIIPGRPDNNAP
jgi:DNA-binding NarL/FixJ family response regulator